MVTFNSAFKASRCYANGTLNNYGTYISCTVDYQSDTLSLYTIDYKLESSDTWTRLFRSTSEYWFDTTYVSTSSVLNADYAYDIRITVTNDTETVVQSAFVSTSFKLINFNSSGKGIGIGKVSSDPNALEIGMDIYDRYNTLVGNGLAFYQSGGSTNPNTTTEELILTSTNTPNGGLFFIRTMFYSAKSSTSNRSQCAYPYSANGSTFYRTYFNGSWTAWSEQPVITNSGSFGIWNYREYSDGTKELLGQINLYNKTVTSPLGGWYRSDVLYDEYAYPYPIWFSSEPIVNMTFTTTNGNGAICWSFSANSNNARAFLPQCYLIRPTSASNISGNISIIAKNK